jgi:hypothetical protein
MQERAGCRPCPTSSRSSQIEICAKVEHEAGRRWVQADWRTLLILVRQVQRYAGALEQGHRATLFALSASTCEPRTAESARLLSGHRFWLKDDQRFAPATPEMGRHQKTLKADLKSTQAGKRHGCRATRIYGALHLPSQGKSMNQMPYLYAQLTSCASEFGGRQTSNEQ